MRLPIILGVIVLWTVIIAYIVRFLRNRKQLQNLIPHEVATNIFALVPPDQISLFNGEELTEYGLKQVDKLKVIDSADPKQRTETIDLIETLMKRHVPFMATFAIKPNTQVCLHIYTCSYCEVYADYPNNRYTKITGKQRVETEIARRIAQSSGAILIETNK